MLPLYPYDQYGNRVNKWVILSAHNSDNYTFYFNIGGYSPAKDASYTATTSFTYDGNSKTAVTGSNVSITGTNTATNAGSYTATVTPSSGHAWSDGSTGAKTVSWSISPKSLTIPTLSNTAKTYNGSAQSPTVSNYDSNTMTQSGTASATNVGNYTVKWTLRNTTNYKWSDGTTGEKSGSWSIGKASVSPTVNMNGYTYGGTKSTPTISNNTGSGAVTYYYNTTNSNSGGTAWSSVASATSLNAGTYYMYATIEETTNYNGTTTATKSFTISKAGISPAVSISGWTYGDAPNAPSVSSGNPGNGGVTYTYSGRNGTSYSSGTAPTNAGDYTVTATVAETTNYNSGTARADFTIDKKPISGVTWGETSFIYNGAPQAPTATADGLVNGDTCTVTVTRAATNAGDYTATASGLSNTNYKLSDTAPATSFTISKASLTVTADNVSVIYGAAPTYTASLDGLQSGDSFTPTFSCDYTATSSIGSYTITPGGVTSDNYNISFVSGTLTVEQREIGISWSGTSFTYDRESHIPTATATGAVNGDELTLTVEGEQANAGTYTATVTGIGGTNSENYKLPAADTTSFTIEQASIDMGGAAWNYSGSAFTYDGTEKTVELTNLPEGVSVVSYSDNSATDAGGYIASAVLTYTDTANYITPTVGTCAWTISPKDIAGAAVTLGGELTYTGAALTKSVTSVVIDGLNATYDVTGDTATNAGDKYTLTVEGTGNFTGTATADWSIAKRDITGADITLGTALTYDGTVQTQALASVTAGGVAVTTYTITNNTGTEAGDYTLTVEGTGNFFGTASAPWNIARKSVAGASITLDGAALTYDGTAQTKNILGVTVNGLTPTYTVSGDTQTSAGDYELTIHGTDNFTGEQAASWSIARQIVTVSGIAAVDKVYDATDAATLDYSRIALAGKIEGDDLTATATGTFADADAGAGKTVSITEITLVGASKDNYALSATTGTGSANIDKRPVTIQAQNQTIELNTVIDTALAQAALSGQVEGHALTAITLTDSGSTAVTTSGTITPAAAVIKSGDNDVTANYEITYAPGVLTVTKIAPIADGTITASGITFGQTLADSTITGAMKDKNSDAPVEGTFAWKVPTTAPEVSNSGTPEYDVIFTPTDAANYGNTALKVKLSVAQATPTITVKPTASNIPRNKTLSDSKLTGGKVMFNGKEVIGKFAWTDKTISPGTAGTAGYEVTFTPYGTDGVNLTATTTTVNVTAIKDAPAAITISPTPSSYVYGSGAIPTYTASKAHEEAVAPVYYYSTGRFALSDVGGSGVKALAGKTNTSLSVGSYFVAAYYAASANYSAYLTEPVQLNVTKGTRANPTAPTVSTATQSATIASADRNKKLEYLVALSSDAAPTSSNTGALVSLRSGGTLPLEGLKDGTAYKLYIRERGDGNYNPSAWVASAEFTFDKFSVSYNANGGTGAPATVTANTGATITIDDGAGVKRNGYSFAGWYDEATDGARHTGSATTGMKLYAHWTPNSYTVRFNANGGVGSMSDESFTYDSEAALTANAITRTDYHFIGWSEKPNGSVRYSDGQTVKNLTAEADGTVTLYAVWELNVYDIRVAIESEDRESTLSLALKRGNAVFANRDDISMVSGSATYAFNNVPRGNYNLVAEQGTGDGKITMTVAVVITDANESRMITMPNGKINSMLEVATDAPPVVVDGLAEEAASKAIDSSTTVTVSMSVTKQEAQELAETATAESQETQEAIKEIEAEVKKAAGRAESTVEFMNIEVEKTIKPAGGDETTEAVTETLNIIELIIPYDFSDKSLDRVKFYRYHNGEPASLTRHSGTRWAERDDYQDGYFYLDQENSLIYLYANQFSTYAISYTEAIPYTPSSYSPTYTADTKTERTMPEENPNAPLNSASDCLHDDSCPISAYADADSAAWYHDGVHWALENGVMNGIGNGLFTPNDDTSRAMVAVMLWRLEGKPTVNEALTFADVQEKAWYTEGVRWAASVGVITGWKDAATGKLVFAPNSAITREQIAAMLWRYAKYKGADVSIGEDTNILSYDDAFDIAEYAIPAVQWACGSGIVGGMEAESGRFGLFPRNHASRAVVATMFMRYCTKINQ